MSGRGAGFDWQIVTRSAMQSAQGNIRVCERRATVRSLATGRGYIIATDEACPP